MRRKHSDGCTAGCASEANTVRLHALKDPIIPQWAPSAVVAPVCSILPG